jgi:uncharacterized surface protein with fasciclin (FAS1) repeats
MRTNFKFLRLSLVCLITLSFFNCDDDSNDDYNNTPEPLTIVETAQATESLSSLVAAVVEAGLVDTLNSEGPFTVLAPTNAAFQEFLNANGWESVAEIPDDALVQVLLNHVIAGEVKSTDLSTLGSGYTNSLASGPNDTKLSLFFNTTDGVKFNGISSVGTADIIASNGVVHVIDKVIGLPTIVDFAISNPNLSTLVTALTTEDLSFDYVGALSNVDSDPFTVFAPTNDAFANLLDFLNATGLEDIDEPTLKATLDHHAVANANVLSTQLIDDMPIETLGGTITANVTGGARLTDMNNRTSDIIAVDIQAINGVIHVINEVLLFKL